MIKKPTRLAYHLKLPNEELIELADNSSRYYYKKEEIKTHKDGSPKIKNGKVQIRILFPSKGKLKIIQSRIKHLLAKIELPSNILGGVKKCDNIKNAKVHKGKKYHFCTDLKDFFPFITNKAVYNTFIQNGFSPDVSSLLTKLTTCNGELPQGTPTSTHIANLAFLPTDMEIINLCESNKITYTRYVDDLTFSSQDDFQNTPNPN